MHAHCHHKAIIKKAEHEQEVLKSMGAEVELLNSGCCGMAGSFGFERDKYDVSVKVGEHMLLPSVRRAGLNTALVADGFSCREQISQLTTRHALHFAEILDHAVKNPDTRLESHPESPYIAQHERAVRKSKRRTATVLALLAGAAVALGLWKRSRA
jgi:hypothetical protein